MKEDAPLEVSELVVLKKYEGEPEPENEFERLTVKDGIVLAHEVIENSVPIGPVENSELVGRDIGPLVAQNNKKEE